MITHVEMGFQMGFIMKLVELNLRKYGHTYPFIVAVNKSKSLNVKFDNETVMDTKLCRIREGMLLAEEESEPNDTYIDIVMLRLRSDEDEASIPKLYEEVANKYSPDAIGYVQSCLYNEYKDPNAISRDDMLQDPENIQVINMSYYLKGDPVPRISIMPFINKGMDKEAEKYKKLMDKRDEEYKALIDKRTEEDKTLSELLGEDNALMDKITEKYNPLLESLEKNFEHKIIIASCGWFTPYYKIEPIIPYPYKGIV